MRLVVISDTHNQLSKINLPEGDVLIHAGDATLNGTYEEVTEFRKGLEAVEDRYTYGVILVAGNHDLLAVKNPDLYGEVLRDFWYLQDEEMKIDGLKIYGSPWTPRFHDWAFMEDRGKPIEAKWAAIPTDTDILITHGPPFGILDWNGGHHVGCESLRNWVDQFPPTLHIFGHIHGSYGVYPPVFKAPTTISINAASCDEEYRPVNAPVVIDLEIAQDYLRVTFPELAIMEGKRNHARNLLRMSRRGSCPIG